jgi:hypothetical protein
MDGASHRPPSPVRTQTVAPPSITSDKGVTVLMRCDTQAYTVTPAQVVGAANSRASGRVVVEQLADVDLADVL